MVSGPVKITPGQLLNDDIFLIYAKFPHCRQLASLVLDLGGYADVAVGFAVHVPAPFL